MTDKRDDPPPTERTIIRPARPAGGAGAGAPVPPQQGFAPPSAPPPSQPQGWGGGQAQGGWGQQQGGQAQGFAPPPAAPAPGAAPARLNFGEAEPALFGPEPLVAAAGRLIHLASRVREMPIGPDLSQLRQLVIRELEAFSKRAQGLGLDPKTVQLAHYILCAFMDDAVMSTPWGANSIWSQHSLLAAYHNDVQGGDRLFNFAERMEQDPNREPRLMELLYQALSLGFEGRAALARQGESMLHQHRSRLAQAIDRTRTTTQPDLSPQWRGMKAGAGRYLPKVPLWAICAGLGVLALIVFSAYLFRLSSETSAAVAALDQAVGSAQIVAPPPTPESKTPTFDRIAAILEPDIASGRVAVLREGNDIVLRLVNQGLFESAQAEPSGAWADTFGRLAQAANLTKGAISITGHTDNQQIRSLAFPSNLELSQARARAVAAAVERAGLGDASRVSTSGVGDAQPVAANDTPDGRRQNRRVEIRAPNDIVWK